MTKYCLAVFATLFLYQAPAQAQTKADLSLTPKPLSVVDGTPATPEQQAQARALIQAHLATEQPLSLSSQQTVGSPFIPFERDGRLFVLSRSNTRDVTICVYNNRYGGPVDGCMYFPEIGAGGSLTVAGKPNFTTQAPDYLVYVIVGNQIYTLVHNLTESWDYQRVSGTIYSAVVPGPQLVAQLWKSGSNILPPSEVYIGGVFITPDKYRFDFTTGALTILNLNDSTLGLSSNTFQMLVIKNNGRYSSTTFIYQKP